MGDGEGGRSRPQWHRRLVEDPRVYGAVQMLAGYRVTARRLRRVLAQVEDQIVLDLGAGTGNLADLLPSRATYWALDDDPAKLERLRQRVPGARTLLRSALDTGLDDDAVDWTVCVDVSHHVEDAHLPALIAEIARVTRGRLVFVDALWTRPLGAGALLWRYDRGAHPRRLGTLLGALGERFELERVERYRFWHHYVLCVARPRTTAGHP